MSKLGYRQHVSEHFRERNARNKVSGVAWAVPEIIKVSWLESFSEHKGLL